MGNNSRQRVSLDARLVVVCETIAQLRGAVLAHPKGPENHRSDEAAKKANRAGNAAGQAGLLTREQAL